MFIKRKEEVDTENKAFEVLRQLFEIAMKFYPYKMPIIRLHTSFGSGSLTVHLRKPLKIPFVVPSVYRDRKYLIIYDTGYTIESIKIMFLYGRILRAIICGTRSMQIYNDLNGDIALTYLAHPNIMGNIEDIQADTESAKEWLLNYIEAVETVLGHSAFRYVNSEDLLDRRSRSGNIVYIGRIAIGISGYVNGASVVTKSFRGIVHIKNDRLVVDAESAMYVQSIVDAIASLYSRIKLIVNTVISFFEAYKRFRVAYAMINI